MPSPGTVTNNDDNNRPFNVQTTPIQQKIPTTTEEDDNFAAVWAVLTTNFTKFGIVL
jgi:hypothetical protein